MATIEALAFVGYITKAEPGSFDAATGRAEIPRRPLRSRLPAVNAAIIAEMNRKVRRVHRVQNAGNQSRLRSHHARDLAHRASEVFDIVQSRRRENKIELRAR